MKEKMAAKNKIYTYEDYLKFPENERWEIIDGVPYKGSAPNKRHQDISKKISAQLDSKLKKPCDYYPAPFNVVFDETNKFDEKEFTVVEPDIIIVCDSKKLENGKRCEGAPDVIIEITSSNWEHDFFRKGDLYKRHGVYEYIVIDVFKFEGNERLYRQIYNDHFREDLYFKETRKIKFVNPILSGIELDLNDLYQE